MDARINQPTTEFIESLTRRAFKQADKDDDSEISKQEFDKYCEAAPIVKEFLAYVNGGVSRVKISQGQKWVDPEFCGGSALYRNEHKPPRGAPTSCQVRWLRPSQFSPDDPVLFTVGAAENLFKQGELGNLWFLNALVCIHSICLLHL
jgi:hypothetical protein